MISSSRPSLATIDRNHPVAIRGARLEDATELARLAGELGYPTDVEPMRERLRELTGSGHHWVAVAADTETTLAGWVHVARCIALETGAYAEILGLVVDARVRRAGVGRALIGAAERWAAERGLARMTVRSNAVRLESHPFYAALGYARPKSQHVYQKRLERNADG